MIEYFRPENYNAIMEQCCKELLDEVDGFHQNIVNAISDKSKRTKEEVNIDMFKIYYSCADVLLHHSDAESKKVVAAFDFLQQNLENIKKAGDNQWYDLAHSNIILRKAMYISNIYNFELGLFIHAKNEFNHIIEACMQQGNKRDNIIYLLAMHNKAKCMREIERHSMDGHNSSNSDNDGNIKAADEFAAVYAEAEKIFNSENNNVRSCVLNIMYDSINGKGRCHLYLCEYENAETELKKVVYDCICYYEMHPDKLTHIYQENTNECDDSRLIENKLSADTKKSKENEVKIFIDCVKGITNEISEPSKTKRNIDCFDILTDNDIKTHFLQAMVNLAVCKRRENKLEESKRICELVLQYDPDNIDTISNLGAYYRRSRQYKKAIKEFEAVMKTAERNSYKYIDASLKLIRCKIDQKEIREAERDIEEYLSYYKDNDEVLFLKAICYREQAKYNEAIDVFQTIYNKKPSIRKESIGLKAYYCIGTCYLGLKQYARAKKYFEDIYSGLKDSRAIKNIGWCMQKMGLYEEAIEYYKKVLTKDKDFISKYDRISMYNNYAQCCMMLGKYNVALDQLNNALKEKDYVTWSYCLKANCIYELSIKSVETNIREAVDICRKAQENMPNDSHVKSQYLFCLIRAYEMALDKNEKNDMKRIEKELLDFLRLSYNRAFVWRALLKLYEYIENILKQKVMTDKKQTAKNLCKLYLQLIPIQTGETVELVIPLIQSKSFRDLENDESKVKIIGSIYKIYDQICHIKRQCILTCKNKDENGNGIDFRHYTSINTLKLLLSEKENASPRMRLSNVAYMNDPSEGQAFNEIAKHISFKDKNKEYNDTTKSGQTAFEFIEERAKNSRGYKKTGNYKKVYMTSLSANIDYIYMWGLYGGNGKGCNIRFGVDFFDVWETYPENYIPYYEAPKYPLYMVCYLKAENGLQGEYEYSDLPVENILQYHKEKQMKICKDIENISNLIWSIRSIIDSPEMKGAADEKFYASIYAIIDNMLDEVKYLFKYSEYKDEEEARVLIYSENIKTDEGKEDDIPRIYSEIDKEIDISEIMLGPKAEDTYKLKTWLYANKKVDDVTESQRHYR